MSTDVLPRCGRMMRNLKEPCARMAGHKSDCRSRYALDNKYRAVTGREPDPFAFRGGEWVPR